MAILHHDFTPANIINVTALQRTRRLTEGMIAPADTEVRSELAEEHDAEPIKDASDLIRISEYLIENGRYRDNMLFIIGINFGLRISDLRMLQFAHLINDNLTFKDRFPVFEIKTRNTRKRKKNRYITINDAVIDAITLFLEHTPGVSLSDFLFRSASNNGSSVNQPISIRSINRILKGIANDLGLNMRVSTHTLRKTFCYHQMLISHNDSRKLLLLQKMLGHSSPVQTLDYIGITAEEIDEAYRTLNLGSKKYTGIVDSTIMEGEVCDVYA